MKIENESEVVLSSGRREYANRGIIGLGPDLDASQGYDGGFAGFQNEELSKAERIELADYMIEQWTAFKLKTPK